MCILCLKKLVIFIDNTIEFCWTTEDNNQALWKDQMD